MAVVNDPPVTLETERLRLRRWRLDDFAPLAAVVADPELSRFRTGSPVDQLGAWLLFTSQLGQWELRGYGVFCAALKATDEPIGYTGLYHPAIFDEPELSWSLFATHHGNGYATEMAAEALLWAVQDLNLKPPMSIVSPENWASRRVAERLGARIEGTATYMGQPRDVYRHRVPHGTAAE